MAYMSIEPNMAAGPARELNGHLVDAYKATAEVLASAIAAKDSYERHHVKRVQAISGLVAEQLGLDQDIRDSIHVASLLHDVGKLGVPDYILLKPGPLDQEEFSRISSHAAIGARILQEADYHWNIAEMIRHHHERYDGSGYPDHLSGDQIPLGARVISVAEVYDSLTSDRCYRDGWPAERAMDYLCSLSGVHFDPAVVEALAAAGPEIALHTDQRSDAIPGSSRNSAGGEPAAAEVVAQANRELVSLFEISEALSSTLEMDEVLALLANRSMRLFGADACAVFLAGDELSPVLSCRSAAGRDYELLRHEKTRTGEGITGIAAAGGKLFAGRCGHSEMLSSASGGASRWINSCVVAPIMSCGRAVGTINLYYADAGAYSAYDVSTFETLTNIAALAILNAKAFEDLRDSALKDPLTGLYNARYLNHYLDQELSRAQRSKDRLCLLWIDLDNFKQVNDIYGHNRGDEVLKDAAAIFSSQLRDYDIVVRNGGDEFVVVLPGASVADAAGTADRIRREMEVYAESTLEGNAVRLGVSVGMAGYPDDASDLETLLDAADAAMYRDKRARKQGQLAA